MSFSIALAVLKPYRCYIALALPMNVKQGPTNTSTGATTRRRYTEQGRGNRGGGVVGAPPTTWKLCWRRPPNFGL